MSDIIIYVLSDTTVKVDINVENENIWMSQDVMARLYGTTKQNVSYLSNIFNKKPQEVPHLL